MGVGDEDVQVSNVGFFPIVSAYAVKTGLIQEIDRLPECEMEVSPGRFDRLTAALEPRPKDERGRPKAFFIAKRYKYLITLGKRYIRFQRFKSLCAAPVRPTARGARR